MEKRLDGAIVADNKSPLTDGEEAKAILAADPLVSALVVQRSRAFVKEKQLKAGVAITTFPPREKPRRAPYSLKIVYGRLLAKVEAAFQKDNALFTLAIYNPLA